jgi:protein SCO1
MRRFAKGSLLAALLFSTAASSAEAPAAALDEQQTLRASQAVIGSTVPEHTLLDTAGRPLRLSSFRGKPLLVSFIYTGCFQVCPTQTRALHEAVKGLDTVFGPNQYNVVSIGFNQPFDSPTAMRSFAAQQRITAPNWVFLSPPPAGVDRLTRDFGFSYAATPAGFDHLLGVTVVDAAGRIHTQVLGDRLNAAQLGEPLRELLGRAPLPQQLRLGDLIERVRILCTVYDPDTGAYRYDYKLIMEIIGGLAFFLFVGAYLLREVLHQRRGARHRAEAIAPTPRTVRRSS